MAASLKSKADALLGVVTPDLIVLPQGVKTVWSNRIFEIDLTKVLFLLLHTRHMWTVLECV